MKKKILTFAVALIATIGVINAQEKYAVLITGDQMAVGIPATEQWNGGLGGSPDYGYDEFWNDTYLMWEMLVFDKVYTDANVNVLFGENGEDFTFYEQAERYKASLHGLQSITDANSEKQTIDALFNSLASTITEDDYLFVWVMSHGGTNDGGSYFYSYDGIKIYDSELAGWLGNISAHKKTVFLSTPNSGGFIPELEAEGNIVITAGGAAEGASRADNIKL